MKYERALVIGDLHFPWSNGKAIDLTLDVAWDFYPDWIFLNGDVLDCWQISKYSKHPKYEKSGNLLNEILEAKGFLRELRHKFPDAKIVYIFGNHEYRWERFLIDNAKELYGLKGLSLEEQLDTPALKIKVINSGRKENSYLWGKLVIGHFDKVNQHSGYTAKNLLETKSISLIQNHTHRGGSSYKRLYDRDIVAFENFCLCDRNPHYTDKPNWQLGFSLVYKDIDSDIFYVEQHPILEYRVKNRLTYRTFFNGKVYERWI